MLRKDIVQGVAEVTNAIARNQIIETIRGSGRNKESKNSPDIGRGLASLQGYAFAAAAFSPAAQKVISIFKLDKLQDVGKWMEILTEPNETSMQLYRTLTTMQTELPLIVDLLHQDTVSYPPPVADRGVEQQSEAVTVIRVSLIESHGHFSTASRVIDGLSACEELYQALQQLNDDVSVPLGIGAIDSGSDKSFDLFGAAELMKQFRELVVSIWGLVVFHREHKLGKRLELIAAALPILERVNELEKAGKLERGQAQIIRNGLTDGATKFISAGVVTDALSGHTTHDPRQLLAPEPKLLTGPPAVEGATEARDSVVGGTPKPTSGVPPPSIGDLSDDQLERLADKLAKRSGLTGS